MKKFIAGAMLLLALATLSDAQDIRRGGSSTQSNPQVLGTWTLTKDNLVVTTADGALLQNTTAATGGVPVQMSPRVRWRGTAWDTAASETVDFFSDNLPATAATPTGTWRLGYSLNGAAATFPLTVTSAGVLQTLSSIKAGGTGQVESGNAFLFTSRWLLYAGASTGLANLTNTSQTFGIQFNLATATPSLTTCGTGTITANSSNTMGGGTATGATVCDVTFGAPAWTNAPFCVVSDATGARALWVSNASTTLFRVNGLTAGDVFTYICLGKP